MRNQLTYFREDRSITSQFNTAVSLHGHTNRSRESLYFIGEFASRHALLRKAIARLDRRAQKRASVKLDFWNAYWTPPLPPLEAFNVERKQIEDGLGMNSLISLTDHDNIEAPLLLRVVPEARRIPVSVEWSIHFAGTVFHLGVHNLPTAEAETWLKRMNAYTQQPNPHQLWEILSALGSIRQVLLVFNHPLWDLPHIGRANHFRALREFLQPGNPFLHAFELGGLRDPQENREVIELAKAYRRPVIAGGDRHGCEPSALLNVTNAASFTEFVDEIRQQHSHVLAMPQYSHCTSLRVFHTLLDVIRTYPDHALGSRYWDERVFHPDQNGVMRPLSMLWDAPPLFIRQTFRTLQSMEAQPLNGMLHRALNRGAQLPRLKLEDGQEAAL